MAIFMIRVIALLNVAAFVLGLLLGLLGYDTGFSSVVLYMLAGTGVISIGCTAIVDAIGRHERRIIEVVEGLSRSTHTRATTASTSTDSGDRPVTERFAENLGVRIVNATVKRLGQSGGSGV